METVEQVMMLDGFAGAEQAVQHLSIEWLRRSAVQQYFSGLVVQNERFKKQRSE